MVVRLRLARFGGKKHPFYRIVAASHTSPRDGRCIEQLGTYDPNQEPAAVVLKNERIDYWLGVGAKPSKKVKHLIDQQKQA